MTVLRFLFLAAFFLTAVGGALTAVGQSDVSIRPHSKVQHNHREESEKTESKVPSLLDKLQGKFKPSQWFRKTEDQPVLKQDSRNTEAPLWDNTSPAPTKPEAKPVPQPESDELLAAPLPPQNPYFDNIGQEKTSQNLLPFLDEKLESIPQDFIQHDPFGTNISDEQQAGLSSYSFDSRDWIESFPVEHIAEAEKVTEAENKPTQEKTVQPPVSAEITSLDSVQDSFSSEQVTAVVPNVETTNIDKKLSGFEDDWNSQAVELVPMSFYQTQTQDQKVISNPLPQRVVPDAIVQEVEPKVASAVFNKTKRDRGTELFSAESVKTLPPDFDLVPSYSKHLPHTEICGVVVVQANFPLTEIAPILEEIRLLQRDLNLYIGVPAAKEKIELCLFRDEKSYIQFLTTVFPKAPRDRRALYIKLDKKPGTLLIQKTEDFEIDLRHEMTHAIIHTSIRYVPIWLDEGLAKYFEVPIQDRAVHNPYMKTVCWNTKFGAVPSLARLEKLQDITQMSNREYRDSWAWVHFLIHHSPQTHHLLAGYLQLLSTLSDPLHKTVHKTQQIPPLELYLKDTVQNSREQYREHFQKE